MAPPVRLKRLCMFKSVQPGEQRLEVACSQGAPGYVSPQDYQVATGGRGRRACIVSGRYLHRGAAVGLGTVARRSGNPAARMGAGQRMARQPAALWGARRGVDMDNRPVIRH